MDQELRRLARLADQGDRDALLRLVAKQASLGPPPYYGGYSYFARITSPSFFEVLGFLVVPGPGGRWNAEAVEGEFFHIYFTTNDYSAFLVLARPKEASPEPEIIDIEDEVLDDGLVALDLESIIPLHEITIKDLYHPYAYKAGNIMSHEDRPKWPEQTIRVVVKRPGQGPVVEEHQTGYEYPSDRSFMNRLVDGTFEMIPLQSLPGVSMFVNEMGYGLEPNLTIPGGDVFNFQYWYQPVRGTIVFSKLRAFVDPAEIPCYLLPWPWSQKCKEDPDSIGDTVPWPTSLEWVSLSDEEVETILGLF